MNAWLLGLTAYWPAAFSISYFIVPFANAFFLNAFGTRGTAVIVHKQETNVMLNESYIWDYDAVLKTADAREVALQFSTTSVATYPIRNQILIPPENDPFIIKYVPGFERNIVVMCDESNYGKRRKVERDQAPRAQQKKRNHQPTPQSLPAPDRQQRTSSQPNAG
jgi:hypothetical protein